MALRPSIRGQCDRALTQKIINTAPSASRYSAALIARGKAVTQARLRQEVTRSGGIFLDLLSQTSHVDVEDVLAAAPGRPPHSVHQHAVWQELVRVRRK